MYRLRYALFWSKETSVLFYCSESWFSIYPVILREYDGHAHTVSLVTRSCVGVPEKAKSVARVRAARSREDRAGRERDFKNTGKEKYGEKKNP